MFKYRAIIQSLYYAYWDVEKSRTLELLCSLV